MGGNEEDTKGCSWQELGRQNQEEKVTKDPEWRPQCVWICSLPLSSSFLPLWSPPPAKLWVSHSWKHCSASIRLPLSTSLYCTPEFPHSSRFIQHLWVWDPHKMNKNGKQSSRAFGVLTKPKSWVEIPTIEKRTFSAALEFWFVLIYRSVLYTFCLFHILVLPSH